MAGLRNYRPGTDPYFSDVDESFAPTAGQMYDLYTSKEADLARGFRTTTSGLNAAELYREADFAERDGRTRDMGLLRDQAQRIEADAQYTAPRVGSTSEVRGVGDTVDYLQGGLGTLLPTMGPPLAAGIGGSIAAAGIAAAAPVSIPLGIAAGIGGAAAASIPAFQMEANEQAASQQHDEYIRNNSTAEERIQEQNIKGATNAALESLFPAVFGGRLIGSAARKIGRKALEETTEKAGKKVLGRTGVVGREGALESGTELSQTISGQLSLDRMNPNRDRSHDVTEQIDSIVLGALGGTTMSLGSVAPGYVAEKIGDQTFGRAKRAFQGRTQDNGTISDDALSGDMQAALDTERANYEKAIIEIDKLIAEGDNSQETLEKRKILAEYYNALPTSAEETPTGTISDDELQGKPRVNTNTPSPEQLNEGIAALEIEIGELSAAGADTSGKVEQLNALKRYQTILNKEAGPAAATKKEKEEIAVSVKEISTQIAEIEESLELISDDSLRAEVETSLQQLYDYQESLGGSGRVPRPNKSIGVFKVDGDVIDFTDKQATAETAIVETINSVLDSELSEKEKKNVLNKLIKQDYLTEEAEGIVIGLRDNDADALAQWDALSGHGKQLSKGRPAGLEQFENDEESLALLEAFKTSMGLNEKLPTKAGFKSFDEIRNTDGQLTYHDLPKKVHKLKKTIAKEHANLPTTPAGIVVGKRTPEGKTVKKESQQQEDNRTTKTILRQKVKEVLTAGDQLLLIRSADQANPPPMVVKKAQDLLNTRDVETAPKEVLQAAVSILQGTSRSNITVQDGQNILEAAEAEETPDAAIVQKANAILQSPQTADLSIPDNRKLRDAAVAVMQKANAQLEPVQSDTRSEALVNEEGIEQPQYAGRQIPSSAEGFPDTVATFESFEEEKAAEPSPMDLMELETTLYQIFDPDTGKERNLGKDRNTLLTKAAGLLERAFPALYEEWKPQASLNYKGNNKGPVRTKPKKVKEVKYDDAYVIDNFIEMEQARVEHGETNVTADEAKNKQYELHIIDNADSQQGVTGRSKFEDDETDPDIGIYSGMANTAAEREREIQFVSGRTTMGQHRLSREKDVPRLLSEMVRDGYLAAYVADDAHTQPLGDYLLEKHADLSIAEKNRELDNWVKSSTRDLLWRLKDHTKKLKNSKDKPRRLKWIAEINAQIKLLSSKDTTNRAKLNNFVMVLVSAADATATTAEAAKEARAIIDKKNYNLAEGVEKRTIRLVQRNGKNSLVTTDDLARIGRRELPGRTTAQAIRAGIGSLLATGQFIGIHDPETGNVASNTQAVLRAIKAAELSPEEHPSLAAKRTVELLEEQLKKAFFEGDQKEVERINKRLFLAYQQRDETLGDKFTANEEEFQADDASVVSDAFVPGSEKGEPAHTKKEDYTGIEGGQSSQLSLTPEGIEAETRPDPNANKPRTEGEQTPAGKLELHPASDTKVSPEAELKAIEKLMLEHGIFEDQQALDANKAEWTTSDAAVEKYNEAYLRLKPEYTAQLKTEKEAQKIRARTDKKGLPRKTLVSIKDFQAAIESLEEDNKNSKELLASKKKLKKYAAYREQTLKKTRKQIQANIKERQEKIAKYEKTIDAKYTEAEGGKPVTIKELRTEIKRLQAEASATNVLLNLSKKKRGGVSKKTLAAENIERRKQIKEHQQTIKALEDNAALGKRKKTKKPKVHEAIGMKTTDSTKWFGVEHNMREEHKGKSTMDLVLSGDRTANTSRSPTMKKYKVGDLIPINDGKQIKMVRVTKAPYRISSISAETWSALEGWDTKTYEQILEKSKAAWQFQYEVVGTKTISTAKADAAVAAARQPEKPKLTKHRVTKIISGGQVGADIGGLEAAKALGMETGGTAPPGFKVEGGNRPELARLYGLTEGEADPKIYPKRTMKNVDDADATIAFRVKKSAGTDNTIGYAQTGTWVAGTKKTKLNGHKPVLVLTTKDLGTAVKHIRAFLLETGAETINIAGHRKAKGFTQGYNKFVQETLTTALDFTQNVKPVSKKAREDRGQVKKVGWYTRKQIKANPNQIYVFGDNIKQEGYGGQAAAARGEPNAVGIPTKYTKNTNKKAYFGRNVKKEKAAITKAVNKIIKLRDQGKTIILPAKGLGTNRAQLAKRSPEVFKHLNKELNRLQYSKPKEKQVKKPPSLIKHYSEKIKAGETSFEIAPADAAQLFVLFRNKGFTVAGAKNGKLVLAKQDGAKSLSRTPSNLEQLSKLSKNLARHNKQIIFNEKTQEYEVIDRKGQVDNTETDKLQKSMGPQKNEYKNLKEALKDPDIKKRKDAVTKYMVKVFGPEVTKSLKFLLWKDTAHFKKDRYVGSYHDVSGVLEVAMDSLDPLGVGFHESMHKFAKGLQRDPLGHNLHERMKRAASAPFMRKQLKDLLAEHPEQQAQLTDVNERIAYMFQFYAASKQQGGPTFNMHKSEGLIKQVIQGLARMLRIVTDSRASEAIFDAFYSGDFQKKGINPLAKYKSLPLKTAIGNTYSALKSGGATVLSTPIVRIKDMNIPALTELAEKWYAEVLSKQEAGVLQRSQQANRMYKVEFMNILQKHKVKKPEQLLEAGRNMQAMRPPANELEKDLRKFFDKLWLYSQDGPNPIKNFFGIDDTTGLKVWKDIKHVKNYFPRVWDTEVILKDKAGFGALLKKYGKFTNKEIEQYIENIELSSGVVEQAFRAEFSPNMSAVSERVFNFINSSNAAEFVPYQKQDISQIMFNYIRDITHRREHSRAFGSEGEITTKLLQKARTQGATKEQIEFVTKAIQGLEGRLGTDKVSDLQRDAMTVSMSIVNFAILPLALFSSLIDPLGVMVRTGSVKAAASTFAAGVRQIVNDTLKRSSGEMQELAELVGAIENDMAIDIINNTETGMYMGEKLRKANSFFFKLIGLDQWTRGTRIGALKASLSYLAKYKDDANRLKELGLKVGDVELFEDRIAVRNNEFTNLDTAAKRGQTRRIQSAISRMVDESILRPTAGTRPLWMSDQQFMLLGHLKQFTFTYHNTITTQVIKRMKEEHASGESWAKASLAFAPLLAYVPGMLAADVVRSIVNGTWDDEDDDKSFLEVFGRAAQRSAILGNGTFLLDMENDMDFGALPLNTVLGPVFEKGFRLAKGAIDPDASFTKAAVSLTPGHAMWKNWGE